MVLKVRRGRGLGNGAIVLNCAVKYVRAVRLDILLCTLGREGQHENLLYERVTDRHTSRKPPRNVLSPPTCGDNLKNSFETESRMKSTMRRSKKARG